MKPLAMEIVYEFDDTFDIDAALPVTGHALRVPIVKRFLGSYSRRGFDLPHHLIEIEASHVVSGLRCAQQSRLDHQATVVTGFRLSHRRKFRAYLRQVRQKVHAGRPVRRVHCENVQNETNLSREIDNEISLISPLYVSAYKYREG